MYYELDSMSNLNTRFCNPSQIHVPAAHLERPRVGVVVRVLPLGLLVRPQRAALAGPAGIRVSDGDGRSGRNVEVALQLLH